MLSSLVYVADVGIDEDEADRCCVMQFLR